MAYVDHFGVVHTHLVFLIDAFSYQKARYEVDEIYDAQLISQEHQFIKLSKFDHLNSLVTDSSVNNDVSRLAPQKWKFWF